MIVRPGIVSYIFSMICGAWGIGSLVGGPVRFTQPSSAFLLEMGAPWWFWGALFVCYAVVLAGFAGTKHEWAALFAGSMPWGILSFSTLSAATARPETTLIGVIVYTLYFMLHLMFAAGFFAEQWMIRRRRR